MEKFKIKRFTEAYESNSKEQKGITLIALVVTIIVLIILAGVSIQMLTGDNGILTRASKAKEDMTNANQREQDYLASLEGEIEEALNTQYDATEGVNKPILKDGMIPIKYNGEKWVVADTSTDWYNYIDSNKNGTVEDNEMQWANVMLSDGTHKWNTAKPGDVIEDADLGSMFVWIPRFAYSINEYRTAVGSATEGEGTTQKITDLKFLVGTTNRDSSGTQYVTDYDISKIETGDSTTPIVHPAFTFGGKALTGIWVAKFEASNDDEVKKNEYSEVNNTSSKNVKVLPNQNTWRYIQVGNCFETCLNMNKTNNIYKIANTQINSHLMKNTEWGAVTYLAVSQYGKTPEKNSYYVFNGGSDYEEYSAGSETIGEYKTATYVVQSTTGNVTGIYDMNGGAWEYVAAYWNNGNGNLNGQGKSTYFSGNKLASAYEKYWDKYEVGNDEKTISSPTEEQAESMAKDRVNLMTSKKGDAMYEVINTFSHFYNNTWRIKNASGVYENGYGKTFYNDDFALVGSASLPFLLRGGSWWDETTTGVFASNGYYGYWSYNVGFRPVLVAE